MQPTFDPWIGYFDLIDYVDKFIFLDTVQLNQQSWQTRNKLKIQNRELMFSLPIQKSKSKKELLINEALLDFRKFDFRKKLFKTLEQNYKKSKYFDDVNPFIKSIVLFDTDCLSEYNINIITQIAKKLKIKTQILTLSKQRYKQEFTKGDLVLDVCKYFDAKEYISPVGAKGYLSQLKDKFANMNVEIKYQSYSHPVYKQLGSEFISYIGFFDILYNCGFDNSLDIVRSGRVNENSQF